MSSSARHRFAPASCPRSLTGLHRRLTESESTDLILKAAVIGAGNIGAGWEGAR